MGKVPKYGYVIYRPLYPTFLPFSLVLETSPRVNPQPRFTNRLARFFTFSFQRSTWNIQANFHSKRFYHTYIYKVSRFRGKMGNGKLNTEERGDNNIHASPPLHSLVPAFHSSRSSIPFILVSFSYRSLDLGLNSLCIRYKYIYIGRSFLFSPRDVVIVERYTIQ